MVNETNINKFKTLAVYIFKYLCNGSLNTIQINHVDACPSDVQHNDDLHFVVVKINNGNVFGLIEIHLPMLLKWLLVIECCLKLRGVIYYNINSAKMDGNTHLYHQKNNDR